MYRRILAALDGSPCSKLALDEAVKIARLTGGAIEAVYIAQRPSRLTDDDAVFAGMPEASVADAAASAALAEAKQLFDQHRITGTAVAIDALGENVALMLAMAAEQWEADLIVMGTHGRRGVHRMLLGSVAESLLRTTDRPVLVVRHDDPEAHPALLQEHGVPPLL